MDNDSVSDGRRYRRKSDGNVYRVVMQARSPDGSVILRAVEGPGEIGTTNDRLAVDYEFFRVGEPERIPLAIPPDQQAFFDVHMEAMDLALRAEEAVRKGHRHAAFRLYHDAVVKESDALARVPPVRDRTREILERSVQALTLKAADVARESAQ